ncbi:hypothetical protein K4L44_07035 [Halosquirtibacter laminarini]|uniref:Uncharacterized protein n=1 Tax=Halosquirtibacter laminarini TaxID=3374600 RepID=A0AC61NIQ1_9BACT|nr:hypothetical protein K4L44_07035 [Prolixibacteraceae bacterium]
MKRIELILSILVGVMLVAKIAMIHHFTTTNYIILALFTLFYMIWGIVGFKDVRARHLIKRRTYRNYGLYKRYFPIVNGFTLGMITLGSIFKFKLMSNYYWVLWFGVILTIIIFFMEVFDYVRSKKVKIPRPIFRSLGWIILGSIILNSSGLGIVKLRYRNHPEVIRAYELHLKHPHDVRYLDAYKRYVKRIDEDRR